MQAIRGILLGAASLVVLAAPVSADQGAASNSPQPYPMLGEWGDAPNGWTAYLDNGAPGNFPTCFGSSYGYIWHSPPGNPAFNCWLGPNLDYEWDGNGGICSEPYDVDECYTPLDGDAGLVMPTAFTYGPNHNLITCSGLPATQLGHACGTARWGRDIDLEIHNHLGPTTQAYLNMLVDWDRSGDWSSYPVGPTGCGFQIPERVLWNMPVPPNFDGLASMLAMADFTVGPDTGLVWVRFTITIDQLPQQWIGAGIFELGETEDYMLHIEPSGAGNEYGDAPHGVIAYPPSTIGNFPTCVATPDFAVCSNTLQMYLGPGVDLELDGNHDACSFIPYDHDECFADGDAGLTAPRSYTIHSATNTIVPCSPPGGSIGPPCSSIAWGLPTNLQVTNHSPNPGYLNMLVDWDRSGDWNGGLSSQCPGGGIITEHPVVNLTVPPGFTGLLSQLNPPVVTIGSLGFCWVRFTVSSLPVPAGWTGGGNLGEGEIEDYLILVGDSNSLAGVTDAPPEVRVGNPWPNPARGVARMDYELPQPSTVVLSVYDVRGRLVKYLGTEFQPAGVHQLTWDGRNHFGGDAPTGVYFVHVRVGATLFTRRLILLH